MNTMKIFNHIALMAFVASIFAGCSEKSSYEPGDAENPDNYGVYFPEQTKTTSVELDPDEDTRVEYVVRRSRTDNAIIVPMHVVASADTVFEVSPIAFAAGQSETKLVVKFPKAEIGAKYTCTVSIDDPDYVSVYGPRATSLTFSVVRAGWVLVTGPKGQTTGKWRDDIIGNIYSLRSGSFNATPEVDVEIYERQDVKGLYRMKVYGGTKFLDAFAGGPGLSIAENKDVYTTVNASDPDKVYLPLQTTGMTFNSSDGEMSFGSYTPENFSMDETAAQYGSMKDGIIEFPAQSIMISIGSIQGYYYGNNNGMTRILMPGVTVPDYTVTLTKGASEAGKVDLNVAMASDVANFKYAVFEGVIDSGTASLRAQELDLAGTGFDGEVKTSGSISLDCKKTGKYTLIGCIYDKEGAMQDYASISFGFIARGETKPVKLTFGLEATNEYAATGVTPDNSAKFYAYGEDVETITYGLYKKSAVKSDNLDKLLDESGKDFSAEDLEKVNGNGYSAMLKGLNGNSEYVLVVRAFNGYTTSVSTASYKTTGKFNPVLETYEYSDFLQKQPSVSELTGTKWNFYAMDMTGDETVHRKISTVSIVDMPGESTEKARVLAIDGMVDAEFSEGGLVPAVYIPESSLFDGYQGAFALYGSQNGVGTVGGSTVFLGFIPDEDLSNVYFGYGMFFGEVADGYLYAVAAPSAIEQGYTFSYLYIASNTELYGLYTQMMLVDETKDMGGIPDEAKTKMASIRKRAAAGFKPRNYVELPEYAGMVPAVESVSRPQNLAISVMPASAPSARRATVTVKTASSAHDGKIVFNGVHAR